MDDLQKRELLIEKLIDSDKAVEHLGIQTKYKRFVWRNISSQIEGFLSNQAQNHWILIPGLRGIGKTTLLCQIYQDHPSLQRKDIRKFFISLDDFPLAGLSIRDLLESLKDLRFRHKDKPFFVFLDEVHTVDDWSLGCKLIYDNIPNLFLICTGSSALSLQLNPDSARRADLIKMRPLNFREFIEIKLFNSGVDLSTVPNQTHELSKQIHGCLFDEFDIEDIFRRLVSLKSDIDQYYGFVVSAMSDAGLVHESTTDHSLIEAMIEEYITDYRTFPFLDFDGKSNQFEAFKHKSSIQKNNISLRKRRRLLEVINKAVAVDLLRLLSKRNSVLNPATPIQTTTFSYFPHLLYILANSLGISSNKISSVLGVKKETLDTMLEVLVRAEIITEVKPIKASVVKNTRTSKYLFSSPALRQALVSKPIDDSALKGDLLEDTIIMQLKHSFDYSLNENKIEYDSTKGGADFAISSVTDLRPNIVLEVGYHKKSAKQISQTMGKFNKKYHHGLVITTGISEPKLSLSNKAVFVPLSYFLLS